MKTKFIEIPVNTDLAFREAIYNLDPFQTTWLNGWKIFDEEERDNFHLSMSLYQFARGWD